MDGYFWVKSNMLLPEIAAESSSTMPATSLLPLCCNSNEAVLMKFEWDRCSDPRSEKRIFNLLRILSAGLSNRIVLLELERVEAHVTWSPLGNYTQYAADGRTVCEQHECVGYRRIAGNAD